MVVELRKFAPSAKIPGDLIKSEDWNEATKEIERLEKDKLNREGADSLQGPLTIREALRVGVTDTNNLTAKLQVEGDAIVSGNVGIGTTSPQSKLTINSITSSDSLNSSFSFAKAQLTIFDPTPNISKNGSTVTCAETQDILHLVRAGMSRTAYANKVSLAIGRYEHPDNTDARTQLDIKLTDGGFSNHHPVMSLRSNGKVGIGTTSPQQLLEIGPALTTSSILGTGTISSSDTTVTGTGTQFQSQLQIGDFITVTFNGVSQTRRVASITSVSQLKTDTPFDPVISVGTTFTFLRQVLSVNGASQLRGTLDITGIANTSGQISLQLRSGNNSTNFNSNQITFSNSQGLHRHAIKTRHNPDARSGNAIDFYVWRRLGSNVPADRDLYNDIGTLHTMTLDGGNVGIGTTSPTAKLDIAAQTRTGSHPTDRILYVTGGMEAAAKGVEFRKTDATEGIGFGCNTIYAAGSNANQDLNLKAKGTTGKVKVASSLETDNLTVTGSGNAIVSNGNVGIGTNNPQAKLQVVDQSTNPQDGTTLVLGLTTESHLRLGYNTTYGWIQSRSPQGLPLVLNPLNTSNVGIGTTDPKTKLQVSGAAATTSVSTAEIIRLLRPAAGTGVNDKKANAVGLFLGTFETGASGKTRLDFKLSGAPASGNSNGETPDVTVMTLQADGNVGIGTTSPKQLLEIGPPLTTNSIQGTGTIISSSNSSDTTVTGTDTQFQSQLQIGDFITVTFNGVSQTRRVASITSASQLKTDAPFDPVISVGTAFTFLHQVLSVNGASQLRGTLDITGIANTGGQISLQVRSGNSSTNFSSNQITFGNSEGLHRHAIKTRHNPDARSGNAIDFYVWRRLGTNVPAERDLYNDIGTLHTMTLDGGNVGIGTTDPKAKLHIINQSTDAQGKTLVLGPTTDTFLSLGYNTDYGWIQSFNSKPLALNPLGNNVGIGTTDPKTKLYVDSGLQGVATPAAQFQVHNCGAACGQSPWTEAVRLWNNNGLGRVGLGFLTGGTGDLSEIPQVYLGTGDNSNSFRIATKSQDTLMDRMFIDGTDGKVGIGTTSPTEKLEVSGNIKATDLTVTGSASAVSLTVSGAATFNGTVTANNLVIEQEAWKNLNPLGGWTADIFYPPQYYKDSFGIVHFRGAICGSLSQQIQVLALGSGYIPDTLGYYVAAYTKNEAGMTVKYGVVNLLVSGGASGYVSICYIGTAENRVTVYLNAVKFRAK